MHSYIHTTLVESSVRLATSLRGYSFIHTVIWERLKLQLASSKLWRTCDWIAGSFTWQGGTTVVGSSSISLYYFVSPYSSYFWAFLYQLFATVVLGSIPHRVASTFFFNFLIGSGFFKFFFILINFIFTMVGILHFRLVQFSTLRIYTVFYNTQFHVENKLYGLENFLQHLITHITFPKQRFFSLELYKNLREFLRSSENFYKKIHQMLVQQLSDSSTKTIRFSCKNY